MTKIELDMTPEEYASHIQGLDRATKRINSVATFMIFGFVLILAFVVYAFSTGICVIK